jgi:hypothetical protein
MRGLQPSMTKWLMLFITFASLVVVQPKPDLLQELAGSKCVKITISQYGLT